LLRNWCSKTTTIGVDQITLSYFFINVIKIGLGLSRLNLWMTYQSIKKTTNCKDDVNLKI